MIHVSAVRGAFMYGGLLAVAASLSLAGPPADDVRKGYVPAPPGSETLTAPMDPVSIQMFTDANFLGTQANVSGVDTTVKPGVRYVYVVVAVDKASPPNMSERSDRVEETAR